VSFLKLQVWCALIIRTQESASAGWHIFLSRRRGEAGCFNQAQTRSQEHATCGEGCCLFVCLFVCDVDEMTLSAPHVAV
jgi:hypothetical protein